jgi:hypothetical protein
MNSEKTELNTQTGFYVKETVQCIYGLPESRFDLGYMGKDPEEALDQLMLIGRLARRPKININRAYRLHRKYNLLTMDYHEFIFLIETLRSS